MNHPINLSANSYTDLSPCTGLTTQEQAYSFSTQVKEAALSMGFDSFQSGLFSVAVSEITINAVRYANGAQAYISTTENGKGLHIEVEDQGPGIADLDQAMQAGYSSFNSLGLGLRAAQRAVDELQITTSVNGTKVCLTSYLPISNDVIDIGSVSFPKVGEAVNGDGYCICQYHGESVLLALYECHEEKTELQAALLMIKTFIKGNLEQPLDVLAERFHHFLQQKNYRKGVEMALLRITPVETQSLIIGDLTICSIFNDAHQMSPYPGKFGVNMPVNYEVRKSITTHKYCFAIHTNGLKNITLNTNEIADLTATKYAEQLFDKHAIAEDDATIIMVKACG